MFPRFLISEGGSTATPAAGNVTMYAKADGLLYSKDDAGAETLVSGGAGGAGPTYTAWTPALTAVTTNPTLGTGSSAGGRYFQDGKHVVAYGALRFGTSGVAAGSGSYRVSLPVTSRTPATFDMNFFGSGYLYDDSAAAVRHIYASYISTTTVQLTVSDGSSAVAHDNPWIWAASDILIFHFDYEAA